MMLRLVSCVVVLAACSRGVQLAGNESDAAAPAASTAAPTGTIIVANMGDHTATLIDVATKRVVATLPTGQGAHEVAVSRDGRWAVVSNYGVRGAPGWGDRSYSGRWSAPPGAGGSRSLPTSLAAR